MPAVHRLALFGGSFDPLHEGHLSVARRARGAFDLDRVVLVPAARPPHKAGVRLAPGADRLAMAELAAAEEPWLGTSGLELGRPGPSYTIDTVRALPAAVGAEGAEVWFVIGSDNLPGLPGWRDVEALLALARPIVVWRGEGEPGLPAEVEVLGVEARARLREGLLVVPPHPASATAIRAALARGERSPAHLPLAVADYVAGRGLYTT